MTGILPALGETEALVAKLMRKPSGMLKITAGPEYGAFVVNRWIADYLKSNPYVRVEAEFSSRVTDII